MNEEPEFDPAQRHLCPDGSCTGLVGADGRCTVCGLEGEAPPPGRGQARAARESQPAPEAASTSPGSVAAETEGGFDASRRLCDDGNCVGVIGPDGRCAVCGRVSGS